MPIAATSQSVAAVVRPRIEKPWRMIAPAPRKPMPLTTCAAIRVGSARTTASPLVRNSVKPYAETIVKSAAPTETSRCVRRPASRSRSSRSSPIIPPSTPASVSRSSASSQLSDGIALDASCSNGFVLRGGELLDAPGRELEQLVEARAAERSPLGRRLYLHQRAHAGHDDVHVNLCSRVLGVVEVEQRCSVDDPDRDPGDRARERLRQPEAIERALRSDICARDRRAARATVGLQHIAVDPERALAECAEVRDGANRAADQPLDLDGPPALLPARRLAFRALPCPRGM